MSACSDLPFVKVGGFSVDYIVLRGFHADVSEFVLSRFLSCRLLGKMKSWLVEMFTFAQAVQ